MAAAGSAANPDAAAGVRDTLHALVSGGARVNAHRTSDGRTPLHVAVEEGCLSAVETLISLGAGVGEVDAEGWTPLHWAAYLGDARAAGALLAAADVSGAIKAADAGAATATEAPATAVAGAATTKSAEAAEPGVCADEAAAAVTAAPAPQDGVPPEHIPAPAAAAPQSAPQAAATATAGATATAPAPPAPTARQLVSATTHSGASALGLLLEMCGQRWAGSQGAGRSYGHTLGVLAAHGGSGTRPHG